MEITITSSHLYPKNEIKMISEDQIRFGLNLQLVDNLLKIGAIKYSPPEPDLFDKVEVSAEIKVIIDD